MTNTNKSVNKHNEQNEQTALPKMRTPTQLSKAGFGSRGLIYKILKEPDGPAYVKLGTKTLIDEDEWLRYLKRKTVRRDAIEEEADA